MVPAGTKLGPYEILAPLGAGGMGEVYRARDTRLERDVAVKVLPAAFATDLERRARFEREAKAVAALSHPNILAIHDYGEEQDRVFAVMELLEGESLRQRLKPGPMAWRRAVEIGIAVAEGLAAAHAKGVIHRDIKPENLFVTPDGRVKILDFGLARTLSLSSPDATTKPYEAAKESEVSAITDPGVILGTVGYMSPEQARGEPLDARSDLFALGCVLYEMLAGQRPFARKSVAETMAAILHEEPPEFAELGKDVPPEVERAVRHCLEKQPAARFHSAHDLAFALRALLADSTLTRSVPKGRSRAGLWLAAAVLLVLAVGLAVVWFTRNGGRAGDGSTSPDAPPRDAIDSLAVLPFINESKDPAAEFLGDGLADSLSTSLAQVRRLQVRPVSSTARFKGNEADDVFAVGRVLRVQTLITGKIHKRGDELLVTWQLVDVANQRVLDGDKYRRKLADLLTLQEELTREIAGKLRLQLTGEDHERLTKRHTENAAAYQLYLQGHWYVFNQDTEEAWRKGVECFRRAVALDPNYALAYAGLSDAYGTASNWLLPPKVAQVEAEQAARQALALDPTLAEAHTALAQVLCFYHWDWAEAERSIRRAIQLKPNYSTAHLQYAIHLKAMGRFDEALAEIRQAINLDPLSLAINEWTVRLLLFRKEYNQAEAHALKMVTRDPRSPFARAALGQVHLAKGEFEKAIAEFTTASRLEENPWALAMLGNAHAAAGDRTRAEKRLAELKELSKKRFVSPVAFALVHTGLRDKDAAFEWLHKACDERSDTLIFLNGSSWWDNLRSDTRFNDLLRRVGLAGKEADRPLDSLAILPFASTGDDPDSAFLGEGLCISLTNSLAQVRALKVRPFTGVGRYRGPDADALKAGRELQVRAVLTGTVQKRGDELFITVELIDVDNNRQLWGERFRRKFADLFDVQEELAKEIAGKLHLRLTGEDAVRLAKRPTDNLEAFRLYTLGRVEWYKFNEEGLKRAIEYFEKALEKDPKYALAYSGLADAYFVLSDEYRAPREVLPLAKEAAQKALALDSTLAEAHTSLALIQLHHELDWDGAGERLRRAIELNPNYAFAQHFYGEYLMLRGRLEEGRSFLERAVQLEPHNVVFAIGATSVDYAAGRHDRAIEKLQKVLALDPKSHMPHFILGWNYLNLGEFDKAIDAFQKARGLEDDPDVMHSLGVAYALAGKRKEALEKLAELHALAKRRYVTPFSFAMVHTALGDKDEAIAWLEKAYADRSPTIIWLKMEPLFDPLRTDPRFLDLLRRIGPADRPIRGQFTPEKM